MYRESAYQVLSQTTPENTSKNYASYSINPKSRYTRVNLSSILSHQVRTVILYLHNTDLKIMRSLWSSWGLVGDYSRVHSVDSMIWWYICMTYKSTFKFIDYLLHLPAVCFRCSTFMMSINPIHPARNRTSRLACVKVGYSSLCSRSGSLNGYSFNLYPAVSGYAGSTLWLCVNNTTWKYVFAHVIYIWKTDIFLVTVKPQYRFVDRCLMHCLCLSAQIQAAVLRSCWNGARNTRRVIRMWMWKIWPNPGGRVWLCVLWSTTSDPSSCESWH